MKRRESAQKIQVMFAACNDVVKVVTSNDGSACQEEQQLRKRVGDPPSLPAIRELPEMLR
jgi:hypothetical protein